MMFKSLVIFLAVLMTAAAHTPSCRTRYEMRMKWATGLNHHSYYECVRWGHAVEKFCPEGTSFSAPYQTCVPEKYWEEFPYYPPPTFEGDYMDECTMIDNSECVNPCVDPEEGHEIMCVGGEVVDGQCYCPGTTGHVNGVCMYRPGVDDCGANGLWNPIEMRCVCNEGFEFLNGWCVETKGKCEGAPETAYVRGTMDCQPLECTKDQYWAGKLYPTKNPRSFYQCANVEWLKEMPCGRGTCFDFKQQVCVHARDWVNQCQ